LLAKRSGQDKAVGIELGEREFESEVQQQILQDVPAATRSGYLRIIENRPLA
jgi:hypothetical protein